MPRHCCHSLFGLREFDRIMSRAGLCPAPGGARAGAEMRTGITVTGLGAEGRLDPATEAGTSELGAPRHPSDRRPRDAALGPPGRGDRPLGVLTTGALQHIGASQELQPFRRPVIVGTELVSLSAALTCPHAGVRPAR